MGYATGNGAPAPLRDQSRSPRRVSVTLPYRAFQALEERSNQEGRSLSNLAAYLIEQALEQGPSTP
jgi:macrodomain Ter protein organizer (MatP/YcbG family)